MSLRRMCKFEQRCDSTLGTREEKGMKVKVVNFFLVYEGGVMTLYYDEDTDLIVPRFSFRQQ